MTSMFCLRRLPSTEMAHSSLVKCNLFWCSVSLHLTAKPFEQNSQQNWRLAIFNQSSRTRRFKLNFSAVSSNVLLLENFKTLSLKFSLGIDASTSGRSLWCVFMCLVKAPFELNSFPHSLHNVLFFTASSSWFKLRALFRSSLRPNIASQRGLHLLPTEVLHVIWKMRHFSWLPLRLPLSPFDLPNVNWRALHTNSSYLSPRTPETIIITLGQKKIYNGFSWLNIWTDMIPWIRTPLTWISWPFRSGQPYWLTSPERWKHEMYSRLSKINLRMTRYLARETE